MRGWISVAFLAVMQVSLGAQDPAVVARAVSVRTLRLLAVGDLPPFRQVVEDGVRREVPPEEGSVPPRVVGLQWKKDDELKELGEVSLHLGRISQQVKLPEGRARLSIGAGPWANVDLPEDGDLLVVLWRKPGGVGWKAVRSLVIEEGKAPHAVSIANLTPVGLALIHGEEKMMLAVGRPLIRSLPANEVVPFQIGVPVGQSFKRVASMSLEQREGERSLVFIYPADGESPRQPVKVLVIRETTNG